MENQSLGTIISFGHKKGGVGKSTLVINLANYFYQMNHKIAVIDCDDRDVTAMKVKNQRKEDEESYDIIALPPTKLGEYIEDFLIEYEYVFLDLPGNLAQPGVFTAYTYVDYIFIPTRTTDTDMSSTNEFIQTYEDIYNERINKYNLKTNIYVVFNMVKSKNNPELSEFIQHDNLGIVNVLKENIPDKIEAQRDLNTSKVLKMFEPSMEKIYNIIKNDES